MAIERCHGSRSSNSAQTKCAHASTVSRESQGSDPTASLVEYKAGDVVLMSNQGSDPFVAEIKSINPKGLMQVQWLYRPDELFCGRRRFHGRRELLRSDHDERLPQHVDHILEHAVVWPLDDWVSNKPQVDREKHFFWRFYYRATDQAFCPDMVAVYCTCMQPLNPDHLMLECIDCQHWYHPVCMGVSAKAADAFTRDGNYRCPDCAEGASDTHTEPARVRHRAK